jgi:thymidine kinase
MFIYNNIYKHKNLFTYIMKKKCGSLKVILGCMFSGKTSELQREFYEWSSIGKRPLCINYTDDTRYGDNGMYNHNEKYVDCIKVKTLNTVDISLIKESEIILINEGQFFPDLTENVKLWCDNYRKNIIVGGLDGDAKRERFGQILDLVPHADSIVKLSAYCKKCCDGTKAIFTHKTSGKEEQVDIGGADKYEALCRQCYLNNPKCGSLKVILGCMFSGKTSELQREFYEWTSIGKRPLCINYFDDNRYGENGMFNHDKKHIECIKVKTLNEVDRSSVDEAEIILINEGQFFPDLIENVKLWCDNYGKNVIVGGLDGDAKRERFGKILDLVTLSDSVAKLSAYCKRCCDGTKAIFSHKISGKEEQVDIGGADKYEALCRQCYLDRFQEDRE